MAVVKVRIPTPLQSLTKGLEEVEAEGSTIIDLIHNLDSKYPGIAERVSEKDKIRRFVNFYVNDEDIRFKKGELTELKDGDQISIVPAIAGGV
ncbi:MAG: MoaD family protein [Nitrospirae bacterium]|nr:MoaD family protein [Nitrospirota bacterium]MBF0540258.1 MoaD family protein [Nitrospirota bacterium]